MLNLKNCAANLLMLLLLLTATKSFADKRADIDQLLEVSGAKTQMGTLPEEFYGGLRQGAAQAGAPASFGDDLVGKMSGLTGDRIIGDMLTDLNEQLTDADVAALKSWYATELADKITRLEVAASTPEASSRVMQNLDSLLSDHERVGNARKLDDVLGGGELMITMMKSMQVTLVNAMMSQAPEEQRRQVLEQIDDQMSQSMPQLTEITLASYVAAYSSLTDAEITAYVDFLSKPAAEKFYRVSTSAVGNTIGEVMANAF